MKATSILSKWRVWAFMLLARYVRIASSRFGQWRLRVLAVRQARLLGPCLGERVVSTRYGFRMELDLRDWGDQFIYATGDYEDYTTETISALLRPGETVVDVGANVGFFSLLASRRIGPTGRVVAFEPVPSVRTRLEKNLALNNIQNVTVRHEALSDCQQRVTLFSASSENTGLSSFRSLSSTAVKIEIDAIPWSVVFSDDQQVDLVKIDVEGAEGRVLRGMRSYLARHRTALPDLVIEVSESYLKQLGDSAEALCSELVELGYRMFVIRWDGLEPLSGWRARLPSQFNALFTARTALPEGLRIVSNPVELPTR